MRLTVSILLLAAAACAADFRAGAAQVDITPPSGAPMAGYYYNRAAVGVHDPLHAKAIVIEKDGVTAALVACDLGSLPRPIAEDARRRIAESLKIPPTHVMISATHTHTGPVLLSGSTRYNVEGEMKRIGLEYAASLGGKIEDAVRQAHAALRPARVMSAQGREDSLTFNRRFHMKDGSIAWNPAKQDPRIERPAGPIDGSVPVVLGTGTDRGDVNRQSALAAIAASPGRAERFGLGAYYSRYFRQEKRSAIYESRKSVQDHRCRRT